MTSVARNTFLFAAIALLNYSCLSSPHRLNTLPHELTAKAEIPGMSGVRFVAGGDMTQQRTRPEFKLVTGISTGGLIAPLAFLGSKYDGAR